ncbi:MAG: hypothetical protein SGCHY_004457 [Lobulomycetales sp.]
MQQVRQKRFLNLFTVFSDSVKRQVNENKQFQSNLKQIQDSNKALQESDTLKHARAAMQASKRGTSKIAESVGSAVNKTLDTPLVKQTVKTVSDAAEPVLETRAAKAVASGAKSIKRDIIGTTTSHRYIEYQPKEARERARLENEALNEDVKRIVDVNPNAGEEVVLHSDSRVQNGWAKFSEKSYVIQGLLNAKKTIDQSSNPILDRLRSAFTPSERVESEEAKVVRAFRMVDPRFSLDAWMRTATEFYIPDVIDAITRGDLASLKPWASESVYAQTSALISSYTSKSLRIDSQILDIRKVELLSSRMLDNDVPVMIVDLNTQAVVAFRDVKTGEIKAGSEDNIEHARWRMVWTRDQCADPTIPLDRVTMGWRVMECVKIDSWSGF